MGADVVRGDLDDRESLHRAMAGVLGVFGVPPLVASFMPAGSFERQLARSKNVIDAAADANVAHCVLLSANSAEKGVNSNLQKPGCVYTTHVVVGCGRCPAGNRFNCLLYGEVLPATALLPSTK